jgi:sulfotransferase family protein
VTFHDERVPARGDALAARVRFFVAGVPKAGTTALCRFLGQHPQIFMCPIKEPTFFAARELRVFEPKARSTIEAKAAAVERWLAGETPHAPEHGFALEWRHYEALFRGVRDQRAIGEGSVSYWWAPGAPRAIQEKFPDARFVLMLRNPADRLFSQYLATRWTSPLRTFGDVIALGLERRDGWGTVLDVGRYAAHLERFFAHFSREQFSIHLYEDFCMNPQEVCRAILAFLGVDPDHPIDVSRRVNEPSLPRSPLLHAALLSVGGRRGLSRWLPQRWRDPLRRVYRGQRSREVMSSADRRVLVELYRDEIRKTAELIDRDLSAWLR